MEQSESGVGFLERREVLKLAAYKPTPRDVWTIGYGHTGQDVYQGMLCTPQQAEAWLAADCGSAVDTVNRTVEVDLEQNEFDALVSLIFNVGAYAWKNSKACAALNAGDRATFLHEAFDKDDGFVRQGGQIVYGLVNRRKLEQNLFMSGNYA